MSRVIVMPSIDLENGRVVKRVEGVRGTGLVVGNPVKLAEVLAEKGVEWIHVVDLDGAETGNPANIKVARRLVEMGFRVQYGGGIRSFETASLLLDRIGVDRIVIGTLLYREPRVVERIVAEYGSERVAAAIDAKHGVVLVEGWRRETGVDIVNALWLAYSTGVGAVLYTSVEREGRLWGVDYERVAVLRGRWPYVFEYAGGVRSIDDVIGLAEMGVDAVVIGMAFHAGLLDVTNAMWAARRV